MPSDWQAHVLLESANGQVGVLAEDAVFPAGVEAQAVQVALHLPHVIAAEEGDPQVDEAVPQAPGRFHQLLPGGVVHFTVGPQAPLLLEDTDQGLGGLTVEAACRLLGEPGTIVSQVVQAPLDVVDRCAGLASLDRIHRHIVAIDAG